jgi:hypothetical protein
MIRIDDSYNGDVYSSSAFRVTLKVLGPVLLGFGTIFQPKANLTDHWSTNPQITIQIEASAEESGNPPKPDEDRRLVLNCAAA